MDYQKPAKSLPELISLLEERGLRINSSSLIEHILKNVGYATFDIYCEAFLVPHTNRFLPKTTLSHVWSLYLLDKKLRLLLLDYLLDLELAFKSRWCEFMVAVDGSFSYQNPELFYSKKDHAELLEFSTHAWEASFDKSIRDFQGRYPETKMPPIWHLVKSMTFGTTSKWIKNMNFDLQKDFYQSMGLPAHVHFRSSALQAMTVCRNICAHGSRIWNANFPIDAQVEKLFVTNVANPYRLAALIELMSICLTALGFKDQEFRDKLSVLMMNSPRWQRQSMGFKVEK